MINEKEKTKRTYNVIDLNSSKQLSLFLTGLFGLQIMSLFISLIANLLSNDESFINVIANFGGYTLIVIILFAIINEDIKKVCLAFASRFKHLSLAINVLIGIGIALGFSFIYSTFLNLSGIIIDDNANQGAVTGLVKNYQILSFLFVVIFAPLSEELTYRVGLFSLLRKKSRILAYIVSVLIFTLIHFDFTSFTDSNSFINECLNIPLYLIPGLVLTYTYEKEGLAGSYLVHLINNLISFITIFAI